MFILFLALFHGRWFLLHADRAILASPPPSSSGHSFAWSFVVVCTAMSAKCMYLIRAWLVLDMSQVPTLPSSALLRVAFHSAGVPTFPDSAPPPPAPNYPDSPPPTCPVASCQWPCPNLDALCAHLSTTHRLLWEENDEIKLDAALNDVMHPIKATWGSDAGFCRMCHQWWADTETGRREHNNRCAGMSEQLMQVMGHRSRAGIPAAAGVISITNIRVNRLPDGTFDVGGKILVACECGSTFTDSKGVNHSHTCFYCSLVHLDDSCTAEQMKNKVAPLANICAAEKAQLGAVVVDYAAPNQCAAEDSVFAYVALEGDMTLVRKSRVALPSPPSSSPSISGAVQAHPMGWSITATQYVRPNRVGPCRPHRYLLQLDSGAHYNALVPPSAIPLSGAAPLQTPPLELQIQLYKPV